MGTLLNTGGYARYAWLLFTAKSNTHKKGSLATYAAKEPFLHERHPAFCVSAHRKNQAALNRLGHQVLSAIYHRRLICRLH